ncbi:MAG: MoxR family ATPase [Planctomycetota bacterium]
MREAIQRLSDNVKKVLLGKDDVVDMVVTALVAKGHVLLEDVPGLGKTLLARTLAASLDATFRRIQFTPDLLPTDVTGVSIFDPASRSFSFQPGPVFTEVLLADEINRTSPRTQSALLEAMEERQVTSEGATRPLPPGFFVIATQNPVEIAGNYPLPEAQLDRFLVRIAIGYPAPEDEARILEIHGRGGATGVDPVTTIAELEAAQREAAAIPVGPVLRDYVVAIARATRERDDIALGVSPRGSLALLRCAQARAWCAGRDWVGPDDVKAVAPAVLGHRLVLSPQRELSGQSPASLVREILGEVPVPFEVEAP